MLEGNLCFYFETGTEGGYWVFASNEPILEGQTAHDRLHILKNGERLKIHNPTDKLIIWNGVINLIQFDLFTENVKGMWIHADQKVNSRDEWSTYFLSNYPTELRKQS